MVGWAGLIYASSSTVITARGLYDWVFAHALSDDEDFRAFAAFWGVGWFAIVKGWHAAEYALLFWFLKRALGRVEATHPRRTIAPAFLACVLFAGSDEYHQSFVPGRNGTTLDVGIDGLGAGLAALISIDRERRKGARMSRGMVARLVLWSSISVVPGWTSGCGSNPPGPLIYRFETGDYKFEYDGQQKRITIGDGLMRMVRHPEDIEVSDGALRVGPRDYGAVAKNDTISVVGGKVAVNGQERQTTAPRNGP